MAFNNKLKGERQSAEEIFRQKIAEKKISTIEEEIQNAVEEKAPIYKKEENSPKKSKLWGCLWAIAIVIAVIRFIAWILQ